MGLSSQAVLGMLTSRKHDVGKKITHFTQQKVELSRDSQRISRKYNTALSSKSYKWSNNGGASYQDLTYGSLMKPSVNNQYKPYLITNQDGRVIVDDKFLKYAKMISPDGSKGGDWESNREAILSEITGIPAENINAYSTSGSSTKTALDKVNQLKAKEPKLKQTQNTAHQFFTRAGNIGGFDIGQLYKRNNFSTDLGKDASGAKANFVKIFNGISSNMKQYLTPDNYTKLDTACKGIIQQYSDMFESSSDIDKKALESGSNGIKLEDGKYKLNLNVLLEQLLASYFDDTVACINSNTGDTMYYTTSTADYNKWSSEHEQWQKELDAAQNEYTDAIDTVNTSLDNTTQKQEIAFYDELFSAIASLGWQSDYQVNDTSYLDQMLQNNVYCITRVQSGNNPDGTEYCDYYSDIASNCDNIFSVNDRDAQTAALVEYEHEKAVINQKEMRIDNQLENLKTELATINNRIKSTEEQIKANIERTMNIFG